MNVAQDMEKAAGQASALLKALANEHRLMLLCQLADGEKSVGELTGLVGLAQSAVSQHLARLRKDGLVKTRRHAQTIYYALDDARASQVIDLLYRMYCAPQKTKAGCRPKAATAPSPNGKRRH